MTVREERSNQLNYVPTCRINEMRNRQYLRGLARFAYRAPVALDCPKRARFLAQPPEIVASVCALAMCKKNLRGLLQTIQVVTTLDPTANKI